MIHKFISFTSGYFCKAGKQVFINAAIQLNDWLKDNPNCGIIKWETQAVGATNELCIIVEYREKQTD